MKRIPWTIRRVAQADDNTIAGLADVTKDCVDRGASIGFMQPFTRERALAFWTQVAEAVATGRRALLVAEDESGICGTVQLIFDLPDNQPHRADLAKMQVHGRMRRQGLGEALLDAAEQTARECGRTLLVLDAVTDGDAYRLYARNGWVRVGDIPNFALYPAGGYCSTTFFYKDLTQLLRTPRLDLRPLMTSDADALHALWTAPGVRKFLWDDEIIAREKTSGIIDTSQQLFKTRGFGLWAVRLHDRSGLVGFAGLWPFRDPPAYELLYGVDEPMWGRGYASEAAAAVIAYCYDVLKLAAVRASTDAGNVGSVRVLEKLGFARTRRDVVGGVDTMFFEKVHDAIQE